MSNASQQPNQSKPQSQPLSLDALSERVERLEQKLDKALLLLTDIYRYQKLRDFLEAGNWKEADQETTRIMLEIMNKNSLDDIIPDEIMIFPCSALSLLDQLWMSYSKDRFGFSVQFNELRAPSARRDITAGLQQYSFGDIVFYIIGYRYEIDIGSVGYVCY